MSAHRSRRPRRVQALRRQKPIPGGRIHLGTGVERAIEEAVSRESLKYGASRSFVVSVRLADSYGIDIETFYDKKGR